MKVAIVLLTVCFLTAATQLGAQSFVLTNTISPADAVRLVSRLKVGTREEDATDLFEAHKLLLSYRVGMTGEWYSVYAFTNSCSLELHYKPRQIALNGKWGGNGSLMGALLRSNNVDLAIALTNAP